MYTLLLILSFLSLGASQNDFTFNPPLTWPDAPCQNSATPHEESVMTGNVAVRRAANGNIVVIIDESSKPTKISPDGIPDLVYRFAPLKQDLLRYSNISFNLKQARVFFQPGRLAVFTENNQTMVSLSVEEIDKTDPDFSIYGDQSKDGQNTVRLPQGIGLARQVPIIGESSKSVNFGKTPKAAKLPALIDVETDFVIRRNAQAFDDSGFEAECTSGGQGATSCSIGCPGGNSCSITCGSGYWACCKCPNNCRCAEKN